MIRQLRNNQLKSCLIFGLGGGLSALEAGTGKLCQGPNDKCFNILGQAVPDTSTQFCCCEVKAA